MKYVFQNRETHGTTMTWKRLSLTNEAPLHCI